MTTFIWHELTITVGEMSRAAALVCTRDFNSILGLFSDDMSALAELDVLCAMHSPVVVKNGQGIVKDGTIRVDDSFDLVLPLTRQGFEALPYTLTREWIEAAVGANKWLTDDVKKAYRRMEQNNADSPSGNEPSSESTEPSRTTTTIGADDTPNL